MGALVVLYPLMRRWLSSTAQLPEEAYRSPVVAFEVLRGLSTSSVGIVGVTVFVLIVASRRKDVFAPWSSFTGPSGVRWLVLGLVGWATWAAVTWDYNLFYDQAYNVDRCILVGLAALACWRPFFVLPQLCLYVSLEAQFYHPFANQIFARVILEALLTLFVCALLVRGVTRKRSTLPFLFVALCLLASYYWYPGWVKLQRQWFWHGQLYLGGFASYVNGWLGDWPLERVEAWLRLGALADWPGRVVALGSELAALLFFVHPLASRILLLLWIAMHIGIWMFSGISFLVWIVVDVALLVLFFWKSDRIPSLYSPRRAVLGALLMLGAPLWVQAPGIGWFDTRLIYTYRYQAFGADGLQGAFPADATPLGEAWCARDFPYLSQEKRLGLRAGKTNDGALAAAVDSLETVDSIFALEESRGQVEYDPELAARLDRYLAEIGRNWNRRGSSDHWLSWAAPPRTCLSPRTAPEPLVERGRPIDRIVVHQITYFFNGTHLREVRRIPVRSISVAGGG